MLDGFAVTPRYVLRDGNHPSGPSVMQTEGQAEANVIFGFSDKPQYDAFLQKSLIALTPYPLVKGFLQNQVDLASASLDLDAIQLIVLDAGDPQQSILRAATMKAIRDAFDLLEYVGGNDHRLALGAEPMEEVDEVCPLDGIGAVEGLIEDENLRMRDQGSRHLDALSHALGVATDAPVRGRLHVDEIDGLVHSRRARIGSGKLSGISNEASAVHVLIYRVLIRDEGN